MFRYLLAVLLPFFVATVNASEPEVGRVLVEDVSSQILEAIKSNRALYSASSSDLHGLVHEVILPHFDFERMSRAVLVRQWKNMSVEQKGRFENEFRQLMIRIYSKALLEYTDEKISYRPTRVNKKRDRIIVRTSIAHAGGGKLAMDYHLYLKAGEWKIYDIRVEGISLLKSYRDRFGRQAKVAGVDAVINDLSLKNRKAVK